jgi:hypothetical protein
MIKGTDKLAHEPKTQYTPKSTTPNERCSNCEHYVASEHGCNGPNMKKLSQQPRLADGNVKIEPAGWCKFWDANDKKEKS